MSANERAIVVEPAASTSASNRLALRTDVSRGRLHVPRAYALHFHLGLMTGGGGSTAWRRGVFVGCPGATQHSWETLDGNSSHHPQRDREPLEHQLRPNCRACEDWHPAAWRRR